MPLLTTCLFCAMKASIDALFHRIVWKKLSSHRVTHMLVMQHIGTEWHKERDNLMHYVCRIYKLPQMSKNLLQTMLSRCLKFPLAQQLKKNLCFFKGTWDWLICCYLKSLFQRLFSQGQRSVFSVNKNALKIPGGNKVIIGLVTIGNSRFEIKGLRLPEVFICVVHLAVLSFFLIINCIGCIEATGQKRVLISCYFLRVKKIVRWQKRVDRTSTRRHYPVRIEWKSSDSCSVIHFMNIKRKKTKTTYLPSSTLILIQYVENVSLAHTFIWLFNFSDSQ